MSVLLVSDEARVRTLTLNRPDALNAFDNELYDATAAALREASTDDSVAVVVLTGAGRAFCAGTDLVEMASINDGSLESSGFMGLVDALADFPKPLICAVNGLGVGIGATVLGFADLAFMSTTARFKCPFTSLGVAPEAASSLLLPLLVGRQNAAWMLLSAEWVLPDEALQMGLVWRVCPPESLMEETLRHATLLAARPISSLVAVKRTMTEPWRAAVREARERENAAFAELMGGPANTEALAAFKERREPNFTSLPPGW